MRRFLRLSLLTLLTLAVLAGVAFLIGLRNARAMPVVRRATFALPGWPAKARPVRAALLSDVHLGGWAMDPARLRAIVAQIDAARPDLILMAGDFVNGSATGDAAKVAAPLAAELARLHAPLGVVAVLGNHDRWTGKAEVIAALRKAGATVLVNQAARRGALVIGGTDDPYTGHADVPRTDAAMRALGGARVLMAHSPDIVPRVPADVTLVLAGHSHCGQVVLPMIGPPVLPLKTGRRYMCGLIREGARTTVVGAGLGTSDAPIRFGAPPDWWLLTLRSAG